jgi:hypothetical protein
MLSLIMDRTPINKYDGFISATFSGEQSADSLRFLSPSVSSLPARRIST